MANRTYCMLIDIKRDIFEIIKLKPIDTGNKLHIRFSEDGKPVDLTGQTVKFMAIKPDNKGVYNFATIIDAKAGECEVEITNQMTAVEGELDCEIEIEGDKLITTLTFYIEIDHKLNDGNFIESTNEFTVLQKAIRDAYEAIDLMEQKTDAKLAELQTEVTEAIDNMNTVTDNKLSQVQEQVDSAISDMNETTDTKLTEVQTQVNTAISNMNSKTDTKLAQLQSQVNTAIETMETTADNKLADLQRQVTTAISNMNSKTDTKLSQVQSQVDTKLADIQSQFDTLDTTLTKKVNDKITEVTGTQTTLTNTVNAKITELTNAVNGKITEVNNKLKTVDTKITEINTAVSNANTTVDKLEQDVATAIAGIDSKINGRLDGKLDKTGGTMTGHLGLVSTAYITGKGEKPILRDHYNGNVTLSATDGTLYLGYENTTAIRLNAPVNFKGTEVINANGFIPWSRLTGVPSYLPSAGGTITGVTSINVADPSPFRIKRTNSDTNISIELAGTATKKYLGIGSNGELSFGASTDLAGSGYTVYHSGKKPTPADIGASPSSHTHSYLPLAGGTMTGKITTSHATNTYLAGNQGQAIINSNTSAGAYVMLYRYPSTNGYFTMGGYQGNFLLQYTAKSTVDAGTNSVTKALTLLTESGNTSFPGTVTAPTFSGALSGNATTATTATKATTLATARTINGTSFNGSANITTANWGTARTITIGNTGKSVNGAGNVSWSLAEIGALGATAKATSAKTADAVAWSGVTGKPSTFAPTTHSHGLGDLNIGSVAKDLPRVSNLNTIYVSGWHGWSGKGTGCPTDYGVVITLIWSTTGDPNSDRYQIAMGSNGISYCRQFVNKAWSGWRTI